MANTHAAFAAHKIERSVVSRQALKDARAVEVEAMTEARSAWVMKKCGIVDEGHHHQFLTTKAAQVTSEEANLRDIDTYMARRRLRWLSHVRRMDWGRVPRKLLSSWCSQVRPIGRPCLRWAESIEADLISARLPISKWHMKAEDREEWKNLTRNLGEPKSKIMKRKLKLRQQARQHGNQNQNS